MAVRIVNLTGSTRFGLIRAASDFPASAYSVCFAVYYVADRANLFQSPFCVAFDNGGGFNASARYLVMADGSGAFSHNFMMSNDGDDTYANGGTAGPGFAPEAGRWYRMGLVLFDLGGGSKEHRFYYDLPDTAKVITRSVINQSAWDALTYLVFGSVPYTDFEGINGLMANVKVFDTVLTPAQLIEESATSALVNSGLSGNLWGRWPLVSDGNDVSGNGRHVSLTSGATGSDVFFDGTPVSFLSVAYDKVGMSDELHRQRWGRMR